MRVNSILIAVVICSVSACATTEPDRTPFRKVDIQLAKAAPYTGAAPLTCDQATSDRSVPRRTCRIDVNVVINKNDECVWDVAENVAATRQHQIVEWVVKNRQPGYDVRFAEFSYDAPIKLDDSSGFKKLILSEPTRFMALTSAKSSTYYKINVQWSKGGPRSPIQYCQYDPTINNDRPDD